MFAPLQWFCGADCRQGYGHHRKRPPRRLQFEQCEARIVMDAQGMDAQGLLSPLEVPPPVVILTGADLQATCQAAPAGEGELFAGVDNSIADRHVGITYPLNDGKQLVFDSDGTARLLGADQEEMVFVNVEVVQDPNAMTHFPNGYIGTTLIAPFSPPGKILLGERLETLDGEHFPLIPPDSEDASSSESHSFDTGTRVRLYRIWGIAPQWDVDGSQNLDVADLLAVARRLGESREQQRSPTDAGLLAMDLNNDSILNEADVLAMVRQLRALSARQPFFG